MFRNLKLTISDLNPTSFLINFEKASLKFPKLKIQSCFFHFSQANNI